MTDADLAALGRRIIDRWIAQVITLECGCSFPVAGGKPLFAVGDEWHCDEHNRANVRIVSVRMASLAQRDALCNSVKCPPLAV
jgi:hypothetical protein